MLEGQPEFHSSACLGNNFFNMVVVDDVKNIVDSRSSNLEGSNDSRLHVRDSGSLNNQSTRLYLALKPLILTMKFFGMYFLDKTAFGNCLKTKFLFGYSIVNATTLWVIFCMKLHTIAKMTNLNDIVYYGNDLVWLFCISCQGTAMFLMCLKKAGWQEFFLAHEHALKGIWSSDVYVPFKKRVIVYVIICWTLFLIYGAVTGYFVSIYINGSSLAFMCFTYFYRLQGTAMWIVPLTLSVVINDLLGSEFKSFNSRLRSEVQKCPVKICKSLGKIRSLYQKLADVVKSGNEILSVFIMTSITSNVVNTCCELNVLIYDDENRERDIIITKFSHVLFLLWGIINLLLVLGGCVWMKTKVIPFSIGHIMKIWI